MLSLTGGFLDGDDGAALVLATLATCLVGELLLLAVGANRHANGGQVVVRAAQCSAAHRVAPFRIRHGAIPFVSPPDSPQPDCAWPQASQIRPCGSGRAPSIPEGADFSRLARAAKSSQSLPAGVRRTLIAVANRDIAVFTAARAKSLAVKLA